MSEMLVRIKMCRYFIKLSTKPPFHILKRSVICFIAITPARSETRKSRKLLRNNVISTGTTF